MNVKLDAGAHIPTKAHDADGGFDLRTPIDVVVPACYGVFGDDGIAIPVDIGSVTIDTGVHVEIPRGCVGFIKSRSGLCIHNGVTAAGGVIDAGYTGSVRVHLFNHTAVDYEFSAGDKIAQLVIVPIAAVGRIELVDELGTTERGERGFGSSGR